MPRLRRRLYRDRRRLAIVAVFSFVTGATLFWTKAGSAFGLPHWLMAGLVFTVVLTLFSAMVSLAIPQVRASEEATSVALAVIVIVWQISGYDRFPDLRSAGTVVALLLLWTITTAYGTQMLDRYLPAIPLRLDAASKSRLSPAQLWPWLTRTPDTPPGQRGARTLALDWIDPEAQVFRKVTRLGEMAKIEEVERIIASEPPDLYRYHFLADAAPGALAASGVGEFRLEATARGTRVRTTLRYDRASPRQMLCLWIDDALARVIDERITEAEARKTSA